MEYRPNCTYAPTNKVCVPYLVTYETVTIVHTDCTWYAAACSAPRRPPSVELPQLQPWPPWHPHREQIQEMLVVAAAVVVVAAAVELAVGPAAVELVVVVELAVVVVDAVAETVGSLENVETGRLLPPLHCHLELAVVVAVVALEALVAVAAGELATAACVAASVVVTAAEVVVAVAEVVVAVAAVDDGVGLEQHDGVAECHRGDADAGVVVAAVLLAMLGPVVDIDDVGDESTGVATVGLPVAVRWRQR